ncbi:hypothetical protein OF001_U290025 [Pseudomonas sp. OF001]|nr:hypothetical protein OF001_U290025 [Pseudomonas sp. OF001]
MGRGLCAVRRQAAGRGQLRHADGRLVQQGNQQPGRPQGPEDPHSGPRRRGLQPPGRDHRQPARRRGVHRHADRRHRRHRLGQPVQRPGLRHPQGRQVLLLPGLAGAAGGHRAADQQEGLGQPAGRPQGHRRGSRARLRAGHARGVRLQQRQGPRRAEEAGHRTQALPRRGAGRHASRVRAGARPTGRAERAERPHLGLDEGLPRAGGGDEQGHRQGTVQLALSPACPAALRRRRAPAPFPRNSPKQSATGRLPRPGQR